MAPNPVEEFRLHGVWGPPYATADGAISNSGHTFRDPVNAISAATVTSRCGQ